MREVAPLTAAAVLLAAGALKLRSPRTFALTLRKLGPAPLWRRVGHPAGRVVARAIAATEVVVALGLVVADGQDTRVAGLAALGLATGFLVAVLVAVRRGVSCGCFAALATRAAGGVEVVRAIGMLAIATVATVVPPDGDRPALALRLALLAGGAVVVRRVAASPLLVPAAPARPPTAASPVDWPADPVAAFRSTPEIAEVERRLAEAGVAVDWTTCRTAAAGTFLLVTAGTHDSVLVAARYLGPGRPVVGSAHAGDLHLLFRDGVVRTARAASRSDR